ncbi:DUF58 domain-containing protein [Acidothermaceae bacterium B102]|nr:DUF58 domain-containing protein [Acidothermaceae bacterium B102]
MLTRSGWATLVSAVLILAGGALAHYPELIAVGLTGLFALVVAALWMLARPQIEISREIHPARVEQGDECLGVLRIVNRARRRSPPLVAHERVGTRTVLIQVPSLPPGGDHTIAYALPTDRRGVYPIGPLTIGHADPLRLMRVARSFSSRTYLWVHPSVRPLPPLPFGRSRDLEGPTSDSAPMGGVAFHSLREYVPGDDRRLIHWRSSARTGQLLVRHHVNPNEPRLLVLLDTSPDAYTGDGFEEAVSVAASVTHAAWLNHQPVELRTTAGQITLAEPRGAAFRDVLDALAAVKLSLPEVRDVGLRELLKVSRHQDGVTLAVVTGRAAAEQLWVVRQVAAAFQGITLIRVTDIASAPVTVPGAVTLTVRESSELARVWPTSVRR